MAIKELTTYTAEDMPYVEHGTITSNLKPKFLYHAPVRPKVK